MLMMARCIFAKVRAEERSLGNLQQRRLSERRGKFLPLRPSPKLLEFDLQGTSVDPRICSWKRASRG